MVMLLVFFIAPYFLIFFIDSHKGNPAPPHKQDDEVTDPTCDYLPCNVFYDDDKYRDERDR
jgi:hypothetical protein